MTHVFGVVQYSKLEVGNRTHKSRKSRTSKSEVVNLSSEVPIAPRTKHLARVQHLARAPHLAPEVETLSFNLILPSQIEEESILQGYFFKASKTSGSTTVASIHIGMQEQWIFICF